MSGMKYIKVTVFKKNTVVFATPVNMDIDCEQNTIRRVEYLVPEVVNGVLEDYINRIIPDDTVANFPPDAIKTIRFENTTTHDVVWVLAGDADDVATFTTACNQCCDGDTDFTRDFATFPLPILEDTLCYAAGGSGTWTATAPINPFSSNFTLDNLTHDGGQAFSGLTLNPAGYSSTALLATALNSGAGSAGTWSAPTTRSIRLVSTTIYALHLDVVLVPKTYCLALPASGFVGTSLIMTADDNTTQITVPIAPTTVSRANAAVLLNELQKHMAGTLEVKTFTSINSIQFVGLQKPVKVTDGTTNALFSLGACS